jgi:hypothetical protein
MFMSRGRVETELPEGRGTCHNVMITCGFEHRSKRRLLDAHIALCDDAVIRLLSRNRPTPRMPTYGTIGAPVILSSPAH